MQDISRKTTERRAIIFIAAILFFIVALVVFAVRSASTGTKAPVINSVEQRYLESLNSAFSDYDTATDIIEAQYSKASEDVSLLSDADWQAGFADARRLISAASIRIEALSPTARYREAHGNYLLVAASYDAALHFLDRGIETLNAVDLVAVSNSIAEGEEFKRRGDADLP